MRSGGGLRSKNCPEFAGRDVCFSGRRSRALLQLRQRVLHKLAEILLQLGVLVAVDVEHVAGLVEIPGDAFVHSGCRPIWLKVYSTA